jgi:uncharacterized protein with FMN-binding domain
VTAFCQLSSLIVRFSQLRIGVGQRPFRDKDRFMKKVALSLFVLAASGAYVLAQPGAEPAKDVLGSALPTDDAPTGGVPSRTTDAVTGGQAPVAKQPLAFVAPAPSGSADDGVSIPDSPFASTKPVEKASAPPAQDRSFTEPPPTQPPVDPGVEQVVADPPPAAPLLSPSAPVPPALAIVDVPLPRPRPGYRATRVSATRAVIAAAAGAGYADGTYTGPTVDAYYGLVQVQAIVQGGRLAAIKVLRYPSDRRTSVFINRQALPMLRDEVIRAQSAKVDIISGATLTSKAFIRSLDAALRQATA